MMERKPYLYFLTDKDGKSYTVQNGVVSLSSIPTPLDYAPDGWKDKVVNYARSEGYYGMLRSFSIPLRFVKDGAKILRSRLYLGGPEDEVYLIILRLNTATGKHESFYKGQIDFSTYEDQSDFFEVSIIEGGLSKLLKANENTTYEIPLSLFGVDLRLTGLNFRKKYVFSAYESSTTRGSHSTPFVFGFEEGTSFGILPGSSFLADNAGFNPATDDRWILHCIDQPVTVNITGEIKIRVENVGQNIQFFLLKNTGTNVSIVPNQFKAPGEHTFQINTAIDLNPEEKVWLMCQKTEGIGSNRSIAYLPSELNMSFLTKYKTTTIKAVRPFDLAQELLWRMTGAGNGVPSAYSLSSPLLQNSGILLTCGDAIRGLSGAKIKTSWKQFMSAFHRNERAGLYTNGKTLEVSDKMGFFNTDIVYDLGDVSEVKFSPWENAQISKIKAGYQEQNYDDVNGKDEFNNTLQFSTIRTMVDKELNLTAQYRADMYGIEFTRANLSGKSSTDSDSDNDVFMIDAVYNSTELLYEPNKPAGLTITGVIDPTTAFNVLLSPKRILLKHGAWIRGCLWPYGASKLTYQTTEKNANLQTVQSGLTIKEIADVTVGDLAAPVFYPIKAEFETVVPDNLVNLMASNPHGLYQFTYKGKTYKGWVIEASQRPSDNAEQEWTLLLSTDNDLTNLIR